MSGSAASLSSPRVGSWPRGVAFTLLVVVVSACSREKGAGADSAAVTVAGTRIAAPHAGAAGEWRMPAGDYASSRYSELASDHRRRTRRTCTPRGPSPPACCAATRDSRSSSSNTMYLVTPYPNVVVRARPRRRQGSRSSGRSARRTRRRRSGIACCDVVNRGAAYADGKIFYNLLDGHTVAVDAASGQAALAHEDGRPRRAARR